MTEGENKAVGVRRLFENIRLDGMPAEQQSSIHRQRIDNPAGTASGATVIDLRRGLDTDIWIDEAAASNLDIEQLEEAGMKVEYIRSDQESQVRKETTDFYGQIGLENVKK